MKPDWQTDDGRVQLYCGDCLKILPEIGKVDAVITDPPYGVSIADVNKGGIGGKRAKKRSMLGCYEDGLENLKTLINGFLLEAIRISNCVAVCSGIKTLMCYPQPEWIIAWVYENKSNFCPYGFNNWTPILCYGKDPFQQKRKGNSPLAVKTDLILDNIKPKKNGHPTPKPISFIEKLLLRMSTAQEDVIFDPFMGSGTTGIACIRTNRRFIGIEISPEYFEIAKNRIKLELQQQLLSL